MSPCNRNTTYSFRTFCPALSQRLIIIKINTIQRLKRQEKFFCFECGLYLSQEDMSISVAGWFGVCRLCNEPLHSI